MCYLIENANSFLVFFVEVVVDVSFNYSLSLDGSFLKLALDKVSNELDLLIIFIKLRLVWDFGYLWIHVRIVNKSKSKSRYIFIS